MQRPGTDSARPIASAASAISTSVAPTTTPLAPPSKKPWQCTVRSPTHIQAAEPCTASLASKPPPKTQRQLVDEAIAAWTSINRPDLIALTGDFVTGRLRETAAYAAVLRRLAAVAPTFACLGNHDAIVATGPVGEVARTAAVVRLLREARADVLINETREVAVRGGRIRVSGLGDLWTGQNHPARCLTPTRGPGREPLAHVLLNHNPDARLAAMPYHWDLMLCGHTHGGQLGVPGVAEWLAPVSDKSHIEGLRERSGRLIHITRGVGSLYGVRLFCRPQVSLLVVG